MDNSGEDVSAKDGEDQDLKTGDGNKKSKYVGSIVPQFEVTSQLSNLD
jgi:hypothetical protein